MSGGGGFKELAISDDIPRDIRINIVRDCVECDCETFIEGKSCNFFIEK